MRITTLFAPLIVFVLSPAVRGIDVDWYSAHSCEGTSQYAYRNVACNTCISPPFDYYAVRLSGLTKDNRVAINYQDDCSAQSQIGQSFGNTCAIAPDSFALSSVWVACPGQAVDANATYVSETSRATFTADD